MKTKVIVIGKQFQAPKKLKAIEFKKAVLGGNNLSMAVAKPSNFKNIELIARNYTELYDLMFAYDTDRSCGCAYLGHFNDGVVE